MQKHIFSALYQRDSDRFSSVYDRFVVGTCRTLVALATVPLPQGRC